MADISPTEVLALEKLLKMELGYVLDFSNNSLQRFITEIVGKDIYAPEYADNGTSKAKLLKCFLRKEPNVTTGRVINELCSYWRTKRLGSGQTISSQEEELYNNCLRTGVRLQEDTIVDNINTLKADSDCLTTALLIKQIKKSIIDNEPEAAIDRTHTFLMKKFRQLCAHHELAYDKEDPLHSLYGKYVKYLEKKGILNSKTTLLILKSGGV